MERERYNSIYKYYTCHILFGHLAHGSYLPTIEQICDIFHVAPETVRSALMKLQKDGLISVSAGRRTTVTYVASPEEKYRSAENYYLARKEDIENIYHVTDLILMPLFYEGCKRLSDDELLRLSIATGQGASNLAAISMICCNTMIQKLNNRLAKDLFFDIVAFFQFPYIPSFDRRVEEFQQDYRSLLSSCETSDRDGLFRAFSYLQDLTRKAILGFIGKAAINQPAIPQISFHWQTNRDRPQYCHSLASCIIQNIIDGRYSKTDMLPSYEKMAEEFSVSVSTIRRTVGLLRDMGVLNSINGVGSQIHFTSPNWKKLKRPAIEKNIVRAIESVEFFSITSKPVLSRILPSLTPLQKNKLKGILEKSRGNHPLESFIRVAEYIAGIYPYPILFEIYKKLSEFLLFVYPLLLSLTGTESRRDTAFIGEIMLALEQDDTGLFCHAFSVLAEAVCEDLHVLKQCLMTSAGDTGSFDGRN